MKRCLMWMVVPAVVVLGLMLATPEKAAAWGCGDCGWGVGYGVSCGACYDGGCYYGAAYPTYGVSYWAAPRRAYVSRYPAWYYGAPRVYYRGYYARPYYAGYGGWWW